MFLRISFVVGVLCVWCVIGETMPKVMSSQSKKNNTKAEVDMETIDDDKARAPRQLDPGAWNPIAPPPPLPAVWAPRPASPLYTWFGAPWFDGFNGVIRIRPPSAFLPPGDIEVHEHHKHHDHHDHHDHKHHAPLYSQPLIQRPFPLNPFTPGLVPGLQGTSYYIAQNPGAIHIAPLPGHVESVIASNLQTAAGTRFPAPGLVSPDATVAIDGPIPPGQPFSPIGGPAPVQPAPGPGPAPFAQPIARTW